MITNQWLDPSSCPRPEQSVPSLPYRGENVAATELLLFPDADTLVFIDLPPQKRAPSGLPRSAESIPHRIRSKQLLETGSSYFKQLFQPRAQARTIKRRGLEGKLTGGIKYVIDLTPPVVEDDAIIFITELSCPLGIRAWADSQSWWNLPIACVGGQDDNGLLEDGGYGDGNTIFRVPRPASTSLPEEYSAFRHRTGIKHILLALEGLSPRIDTPCKLWTFFSLAKLFEIAAVPSICDIILSWVCDTSNNRLIEIHPEITYRISSGIKSANLCRDSFSVLVGEEALLLISQAANESPSRRPEWTLHGRLRESMDDEDLQRMEYASKSFMDYAIGRFIALAGSDMYWLCELPSFQKIIMFQPTTAMEQNIVLELIAILKAYVRGYMVAALTRGTLTWTPEPACFRDDEYPTQDFRDAYSTFTYAGRILSKTFWRVLMTETFIGDAHLAHIKDLLGFSLSSLNEHLPAFQSEQDASIRIVMWSDLRPKINSFNYLVGDETHADADPLINLALWFPDTDFLEMQSGQFNVNRFDLCQFVVEVRSWVGKYAEQMVQSGRPGMFYELTDTLTCLTDNEFKYLPLWAGGNDDGSGGVFMDQNIPVLETGGFSAPGPAIHTGSTAASSSGISLDSASEFQSTVHRASHRATEGQGTDIISMDLTFDCQGDYHEARLQQRSPLPQGGAASDDMSMLLDSSVDEDDDGFDDFSDSSDTVVVNTSDLIEDMELLDVNSDDSMPR